MAKDYGEAFRGIKPIRDAIEIQLGEIPLARAISIFSRKYLMANIRRELRDREQNPRRGDRRRLKARRALARLRRMARTKGAK